MKVNIGIIGLGNIGKRHLEAVYKIKNEAYIFGYDPNKDALKNFDAPKDNINNKTFTFCNNMEMFPEYLDVAIISTSSAVRREMFEELINVSVVKFVIFEKFLFQRESDYFFVNEILTEKKITAYVNTSRRVYSGYNRIREELNECDSFKYDLVGSNWGLCCNIVHFMDCIKYLSSEETIEVTGFDCRSIPREAKREGYMELFGTISGKTKKCLSYSVSCMEEDNIPITICIETDNKTYEINESEDNVIVTDMLGNVDSYSLGDLYTSQCTTIIVEDLVDSGKCVLPLYEDSMQTHLAVLPFLTKEFEKYGMEEGICPVT